MRLKLIISTGAVIGLLTVSVMALKNSDMHEAGLSMPTVLKTESVEAMEILPEKIPLPTETSGVSRQNSTVYNWDEKESYLLKKIAMAEAEDQDTVGKALVMCVVLNRVRHEGFPDSIEGVIYQNHQFSPISNGRFDEVEPDQDCFDALSMVEQGWDESQGALYFESESASTWHREHLEFLFRHGAHMFYTDKE